MKKYKIGNVNYLNSFPFRYGLEKNGFSFETFVPSEISSKLIKDEIDIGLVPLVAYLEHPEWILVSNYGIVAKNRVRTVVLASKVPVESIKSIKSDTDSLSSNKLCKVLMKNYWKLNPIWNPPFETDAQILIGDKAFNINQSLPFVYDLSEEWNKFTGLPFVFAVWTSNKNINADFTLEFSNALQFGTNNIAETVEYYDALLMIDKLEAFDYLTNNILFKISNLETQAISLFKEYSNTLED